jgi:hypothetical protein
VDACLKSHLDSVTDADVGFMLPIEYAPGHPFLTVNTVRNRFATPKFERALCSKPDFYLTYRQTMLYLTVPCALGAAVNTALGQHLQMAVPRWRVGRGRGSGRPK